MPQQYATATPTGKVYRRVLSASTLQGDKVVNAVGDDIGKIDQLMIDTQTGRVAYAVLSFGGFLGMGDKLFAIPWRRLALDEDNKVFRLDVDKEALKQAPGFDKDHWPDMADESWGLSVHQYYGSQPYWK